MPPSAALGSGGAGFGLELDRVVSGLDDVFAAAAAAARLPAVGEAAAHYAEWIAFAHGNISVDATGRTLQTL